MFELVQSDCLSEFRLDLHLLSQETEQERMETLAHLSVCQRCQRELAWMDGSLGTFRETCDVRPAAFEGALAEVMGEDVPEKDELPDTTFVQFASWWRGIGLQWRMGVAAAMLCLSVWGVWPAGSYLTTKGDGAQLLVAIRRQGQVRMATSGERFLHRDEIRIAYKWETEKPGFLYVLHRDQNGELSALYPTSPSGVSLSIEANRQVDLPGSLEVDDAASGYEEIWGCFSRRALTFAQARAAIPAPSGVHLWPPQKRGLCRILTRFQFRRSAP